MAGCRMLMRLQSRITKQSLCSFFSHLGLRFLIEVLCEKLFDEVGLLFLCLSGTLRGFMNLLVKSDGTTEVFEVVGFLFERVYGFAIIFFLLFLSLLGFSLLRILSGAFLLSLHCGKYYKQTVKDYHQSKISHFNENSFTVSFSQRGKAGFRCGSGSAEGKCMWMDSGILII